MEMNAPMTTTKMDLPEWDLADRLRKSLEHRGLKVEDMAEFLEVHPNTVHNWLGRRAKPQATAVRVWAMRVDLPYEWVAHGIEPPEKGDEGGYTNGDDGAPAPGLEPGTLWLTDRPLTTRDILTSARKRLPASIERQDTVRGLSGCCEFTATVTTG